MGRLRAGSRAGGGLDGLHRGRAPDLDRRDPRRPRPRRELRRPGRRHAGPQPTRAGPHGRCPDRVPRPVGPRGALHRGPPRREPAVRPGRDVARRAGRSDRADDRCRDRRRRRARRLRSAVRDLPRGVLPGRVVPVRPGDGPPRPALPVPVLGGDRDGRGDRHHRGITGRGCRGRETGATIGTAQPATELATAPEPGT